MDDRVLLLQLERAQERLEDRVKSFEETGAFEEIVEDVRGYIDTDMGLLDQRIDALEERQKEILERLKSLTKTCLELAEMIEELARGR